MPSSLLSAEAGRSLTLTWKYQPWSGHLRSSRSVLRASRTSAPSRVTRRRCLLCLEVRRVHCKAVQALWVIAEDLALQLVRDVLPLHQLVNCFRERAVPVGIVGWEEDIVLAQPLGHVGEGFFFGLA